MSQYRGLTRTVAPAVEPITKAEVKLHLDLASGDTSQDTMLDMFIATAREIVEERTGLALIDQTWQLTLDNWPVNKGGESWWDGMRETAVTEIYSYSKDLVLPRYPLQSISSITADGNAVTVADVFHVDSEQKPGRITPKSGQVWPTVTQAAQGIVITFVAGYGASGASVPSGIKLALIQMVAYMYSHRGDDCSPVNAYKMSGAEGMINMYRATRHG